MTVLHVALGLSLHRYEPSCFIYALIASAMSAELHDTITLRHLALTAPERQAPQLHSELSNMGAQALERLRWRIATSPASSIPQACPRPARGMLVWHASRSFIDLLAGKQNKAQLLARDGQQPRSYFFTCA